MQLNTDAYRHLTFEVGDVAVLERMRSTSAMVPFSEEVLEFLNDLSRKLLIAGRSYSDVATFGYWCRRSALRREKAKYDDLEQRLGRGIVFHSTPSNVPVNFAFSFAASLLAGNANVVRLPAKNFPQVEIICDGIRELLETKHRNLPDYICMVRFPPSQAVADYFSSCCDVRIVWGGDGTIAELRKSPLPPRSGEFTFADRYSIAVIHADRYLASESHESVARGFYNDTYFSDQNACTSPRIVIWLGREISAAKQRFWRDIHELAAKEYTLHPVQSVGKLTALCRAAIRHDVRAVEMPDRLVTRIEVRNLTSDLMDSRYNSGFFFEYDAAELADIAPICTNRCQTLSYYGLTESELSDFLRSVRPGGVDRMVPTGRTMDFSLVWDGYDLIRGLSRRISIVQ